MADELPTDGPVGPQVNSEAAGDAAFEGDVAAGDVAGREDRRADDGVPATDEGVVEGEEWGDDELVAVARQRDDYLDTLRRVQAEFDNYRKRVDRQQREVTDRAAESLVAKLLPVLDTADLAVSHGGSDDVRHLAEALYDVLSKEGLERLCPEGEGFDPAFHDAVMHEPNDDGDGQKVAEVLRAGYIWKGRTLRPAMVKVRG